MLSDFKTSINKILNERLTSPFWGAFILSWFIWNWRIPYVSIFVDQDKLLPEGTTRIDYIINTCIEGRALQLYLYPFLSTILIVAIFPFITTLAYWVFLKFNKWKTDMKNKVEGATLLTLDKSVQLREELRNLNKRYEEINKDNEDEIRVLNAEIAKLQEEHKTKNEQLAFKDHTISILEENINEHKEDKSNRIKKLNEEINKQKQKAEEALKKATDQEIIELRKKLEEEQQKNKLFNNDIDAISQKAFGRFSNNVINEIFKMIDNGQYINANHDIVRTWKRLNMLERTAQHPDLPKEIRYELTPLGEELRVRYYGKD